MATSAGAQVLGRADQLGRLAPGYLADCVVFDFRHPHLTPLLDPLGTLVCGLAGGVITPTIYALHPPYKAMGARIGFLFWTAIIFVGVVMAGLSLFIAQIFPWAILAAMIAYVAAERLSRGYQSDLAEEADPNLGL